MILWHLGMTTMLVRYVFRDPQMDLRWVMTGSILPDVIDKPIGAIAFHSSFGTDRLFSHAVVFPVAVLFAVLVVTRRGSELRKGLIGLVIGMLFHVFLDAAWLDPEAFWWPFTGLDFPPRPGSSFGVLVSDRLTSGWTYVVELAGLVYLWFLVRTYLGDEAARRSFLATGRLPMGR